MSRSNQRSNQSVSLFPFLAVLMCAMGSLLTLLIVSTERIRNDAATAGQSQQSDAEQPQPDAPDPSAPSQPAPVEQPLAVAEPPRLVEVPPLVIEVPLVRQPPKVIDPNKPLRANIDRLRSAAERARREQLARRAELDQAKSALAAAQTDLERVNAQLANQEKKQTETEKTKRLLEESRLVNEQRSNEIRGRIARVRKQNQSGSTKYAFVPYDGNSGTTRRPILIECSESGIRFLPENVTISAEDVRGFTNTHNPLLAGAEGLLKYWTLRTHTAHDPKEDPEPYILLIVRPSGSVAFYVARRMLSRLKTPFGYELVEEDWQLDLPEPDPQAVEVCRTAVEDVLHTRRNDDHSLVEDDDINSRGFRFRPGAGGGFIQDDGEENVATGDKDKPHSSNHAQSGRGGAGGATMHSNRRGSRAPTGSRANEDDYARLDPDAGRGSQPNPDRTEMEAENSSRADSEGGEARENATTDGGPGEKRGTAGGRSGPVLSPHQNGGAGELRAGNTRPYFGNASASERNGAGVRNGLVQEFGSRSGQGDVNAPPGSTADVEEFPYATLDGNRDNTDAEQPGDAAIGDRSTDEFNRYGKTGSLPSSRWQDRSADALEQEHDRRLTIDGQLRGKQPPGGNAGTEDGTGAQSPSGARIGQFGADTPGTPLPVPSNKSRFDVDHPRSHRWGLSSPHAAIGYERKIQVEVDGDRVVIGDNVIPVRPDESSKELLADVLEAIDDHARSWGKPPKDFYWVPTLGFMVTPEGSKHVDGLRGPLERWGLSSTVLYVPKSSNKDEAGKSAQEIIPLGGAAANETGARGLLNPRRFSGVIRQPKPLREKETNSAARDGSLSATGASTGEPAP